MSAYDSESSTISIDSSTIQATESDIQLSYFDISFNPVFINNSYESAPIPPNFHVSIPIEVPPGSIVAYYVSTLPDVDPAGWIVCDGKSRPYNSIYDQLIDLNIGTKDNNNNYTPIDLMNKFLIGCDSSNNIGNTTGNTNNDNVTISDVISHTHDLTYTIPSHNHTITVKYPSHDHSGSKSITHTHTGAISYSHTHNVDLPLPDHQHGFYVWGNNMDYKGGNVSAILRSRWGEDVGSNGNSVYDGPLRWKNFSYATTSSTKTNFNLSEFVSSDITTTMQKTYGDFSGSTYGSNMQTNLWDGFTGSTTSNISGIDNNGTYTTKTDMITLPTGDTTSSYKYQLSNESLNYATIVINDPTTDTSGDNDNQSISILPKSLVIIYIMKL